MDVTYEEPDAASEEEVIDHVVSTLAENPACGAGTAIAPSCCTQGALPS